MHTHTLAQLSAQTTGIVRTGGGYYAAPIEAEVKEIIDLLRAGLRDSLRNHQLMDSMPRHPPRWKQIVPKDRIEPTWIQPAWIQHLNREVRVTDNMIFCKRNVSVIIDPWMVEAVQHTVPDGSDMQDWTDFNLQIKDVGCTDTDTSFVDDSLLNLGITIDPSMTETIAWLRNHHVGGRQRGTLVENTELCDI